MTQREWDVLRAVAAKDGKWTVQGQYIFFDGLHISKTEFMEVREKYFN